MLLLEAVCSLAQIPIEPKWVMLSLGPQGAGASVSQKPSLVQFGNPDGKHQWGERHAKTCSAHLEIKIEEVSFQDLGGRIDPCLGWDEEGGGGPVQEGVRLGLIVCLWDDICQLL